MDKKRLAPVNTGLDVRTEATMLLADAMAGGASGAIERQEAQGQRSLVSSDTLPTKISPQDKKALEKAGVKFIGPVEGDKLFQYVELPAGWRKKATDHAMWSDLLDEKGRKRASIFYKAAFYDRDTFLHIARRFNCEIDNKKYDKNLAVANVTDGGKVIYSTPALKMPAEGRERYQLSDQAKQKAIEWLNQNRPKWEDPSAYWD